MGSFRNGARTGLALLQKVCRLSHLPGFRTGVTTILGSENSTTFFTLWDPLCAFIDTLVAADDFFNRIDYVNDDGAGEDRTRGS